MKKLTVTAGSSWGADALGNVMGPLGGGALLGAIVARGFEGL